MSSIDIAICAIILIGGFAGYREGFLLAVFSFFALVLGVLGAFKLLGWAMVLMADQFNIDEKVLPYVAFAVVFIAIVIVVRLLGNMIKMSIDKSFLGRLDQIAGAFFGFLKTAFILSVLLWILDAFRIHIPEGWTEDSSILPLIAGFAPLLGSWISEIFPVFRDIF